MSAGLKRDWAGIALMLLAFVAWTCFRPDQQLRPRIGPAQHPHPLPTMAPVVSGKAGFYPGARATEAPATALTRYYWPTTIEHCRPCIHTHVAVTGRVATYYPRREEDGDVHIKLLSDSSSAFIIAECVPELPCALPRAGQLITVSGISRRDPEHGWYEVHPVESWR